MILIRKKIGQTVLISSSLTDVMTSSMLRLSTINDCITEPRSGVNGREKLTQALQYA